jgi:hypothetical protein
VANDAKRRQYPKSATLRDKNTPIDAARVLPNSSTLSFPSCPVVFCFLPYPLISASMTWEPMGWARPKSSKQALLTQSAADFEDGDASHRLLRIPDCASLVQATLARMPQRAGNVPIGNLAGRLYQGDLVGQAGLAAVDLAYSYDLLGNKGTFQ